MVEYFAIKQGRVHGNISSVQLGRSGDAKTTRKTLKKEMRDQPINQWKDGPMD